MKLSPDIADADNPADLLRTLVAKIANRPIRKRRRLEYKPGSIENRFCEVCGGRLIQDRGHGELYCTQCGLVDADLLTVGEPVVEYGHYGEPGMNQKGTSKATQKFEEEHGVKGWEKHHPATQKKNKNIVRLQVIVAEHLREFYGGWDKLGLKENRKLLIKLYKETHGVELDDTTLWRYVPEITPLPTRSQATVTTSENQETEEAWHVHNYSPIKPRGLNELEKTVKIENKSHVSEQLTRV